MVLKERGLTIAEWLATYNLTKGGRKSSCPCNLAWLYWEMNPNRIPLANDVIYEILSGITTEDIKNNYYIYISEDVKKEEEIVTVLLKNKIKTPQNITICITPLSISISVDDSILVSSNKRLIIDKINNIKVSGLKE